MPTSTITLGLLKIPVSDIEKAATFYESVLGFEKQFVAPEYGWAQFQAGELPMALIRKIGEGSRQNAYQTYQRPPRRHPLSSSQSAKRVKVGEGSRQNAYQRRLASKRLSDYPHPSQPSASR